MTEVTWGSSTASRVPIWQSVKAGYRDTFRNFSVFLRAACIPLVLTLCLALALPEGSGPAAGVVSAVLATAFAVIFELTWFRFLLLGPQAKLPPLLPRFNRTLWLFLGYALLLMLPMAPAEFLFLVLGSRPETPVAALFIIAGLLYFFGLYLSLRLNFSLLWIAVGAAGRFGESWRRTRKNGLRLLLVIALVSVPLLLIIGVAGAIIVVLNPESAAQVESGDLEGWPYWADIVITQVVLFLFYGISCAAIARAFCVLTGWISDRRELLERFD